MRYASGILAAIALLVGGLLTLSQPAEAQGDTAIGVDVGVDDNNSPTSVGSVESCVSVRKDDTFTVDLYVSDVEDLLGWETYVAYDSTVVQVVDRDVQMFQAADSGSSVFNASEAVPGNDDGLFRVAATDTRNPAVGDSGSGVLARLTLKAISEGTTSLDVGPTDRNGDEKPDFGTTLTDVTGEHIGDDDGDSFFDGAIAVPDVFVDVPTDRDCATAFGGAGAATTPDPNAAGAPQTNDDDGGSSWWLVAAIAGAVAALLLALLYAAGRMRRGRSAGGGGQ
jgi:hypothetical protein